MALTRRFRRELDEILNKNIYRGARPYAPGKDVGKKTQADRGEHIRWCFHTLYALGYQVYRPRNFREAHVRVLVRHMEAQNYSAATITTRVSTMRRFAEWIGKPGMVKPAAQYASDPAVVRRSSVARTDRTWTGQDVDPVAKIQEIYEVDKHVGVQLLLMYVFALRRLEAFLLRPGTADRGIYLEIAAGTKGGRVRSWPLRYAYEHEVLALAKRIAVHSGNTTIPPRYTLKQWKARFYRIVRRFGIDREHGLLLHGLRHERINQEYLDITGQPSTIKGGEKGAVSRELDEAARCHIASMVGHSRPHIVSAYSGPKHRLAYTTTPPATPIPEVIPVVPSPGSRLEPQETGS